MLRDLLCLLIGLAAGVMSGVVGIGGGVIIVPALVLLLGLSQKDAQGTTLALMVPPIGILAAWSYWHEGHVDLRISGLVCVGFVLGGLGGAKLALGLPDATLHRIFGILLIALGARMLFLD